jgi:hypothetical protein
MLTTPPANQYEALARSKKLILLSTALDNAFRTASIDPFSALASEHVEALSDAGWRIAAGHARCNPPSEVTKEELRQVYRARAGATKALAYLRAPVLTVVR